MPKDARTYSMLYSREIEQATKARVRWAFSIGFLAGMAVLAVVLRLLGVFS